MAKGYRGIRAGSNKETVARIFDRDGEDAAYEAGEKLKLKRSSLRTWIGTWRKSQGFEEGQASWEGPVPDRIDLQLGPGGRIVIPAVYRQAMQVEEGGRLMARVVDGELRLMTPMMGIRRAQRLVRETIPGTDSLVDALIEERRREFQREFGDASGGS